MIIPAIQIPAIVIEGITLEDTIVCGMGVGELILEGVQLEELYTLDVEIEDQAVCPIEYTPPPIPLPDPQTYISRLYPIYVDEAVTAAYTVQGATLKVVAISGNAEDSLTAGDFTVISTRLKKVVVTHTQPPEDSIGVGSFNIVSASLATAIAYRNLTLETESLEATGYNLVSALLKTVVVNHAAEVENLKVTGYSVVSCALVTE